MERIAKRFGQVQANDQITFEADAGEIHALLGENGAGKTTLMNILYGLYQPDAGEIQIQGRKVSIHSPQDSIRLGVGMVHQHFMLVPPFTVVQNVVLGLPSSRGPFLDTDRAAARITELADKYRLKVDPDTYVWQLSVGAQQRVEILKALYRGAQLLVLDEPTAVLTPQETKEFFATLRAMAEGGHTVIFITHKLEEVMEISDRCTVLRDGRVVGTVNTREITEAELARMMVGREVVFRVEKKPARPGEVVLDVNQLSVAGERGLMAVRGLSLEVRAGEILGLAGVDGNGQTELVESIIGLRRPVAGRVSIAGRDMTGATPRQVIEQKVTHIPEDRLTMGLVPTFSVQENLILDSYAEAPYSRSPLGNGKAGWFLNARAIFDHARRAIADYNIKAPGPAVKSKLLSGGNLQKLVLARAMYHSPRLLVAVQPTRGLDVGATEFIWNRLLAEREAGRAILLISADLDEVLQLSDRIAVLFEGEVMGTLPAEGIDVVELGLLMAGAKRLPA
ncbi:MAG: ABC transporter ATP-binding protein [Chloroflexi bacterium]|nr:ABC transporter ATP-binding protein [Chloroflexota bacterium]